MEHTENEKISLWLTTTNQSNFKSLKVKPESPPSTKGDMDGCLWFYDSEQEQANCFLRSLKAFIKSIYPYHERAEWLTDDWVKSND